MKAMLAEMREQGAQVYDREAAIVLRAIEHGIAGIARTIEGDTAYQEMVARLLQVNRGTAAADPPPGPGSSLIIP